jgi:hypothetical protein
MRHNLYTYSKHFNFSNSSFPNMLIIIRFLKLLNGVYLPCLFVFAAPDYSIGPVEKHG